MGFTKERYVFERLKIDRVEESRMWCRRASTVSSEGFWKRERRGEHVREEKIHLSV